MVQHMLLSMVATVFLALGAPITLALRTLPLAQKRVVMAVLHSRVAAVLSHPLVPWLLFVSSPFLLYFTGWYEATLDDRVLHELLRVGAVQRGDGEADARPQGEGRLDDVVRVAELRQHRLGERARLPR